MRHFCKFHHEFHNTTFPTYSLNVRWMFFSLKLFIHKIEHIKHNYKYTINVWNIVSLGHSGRNRNMRQKQNNLTLSVALIKYWKPLGNQKYTSPCVTSMLIPLFDATSWRMFPVPSAVVLQRFRLRNEDKINLFQTQSSEIIKLWKWNSVIVRFNESDIRTNVYL